MVEGEWIEQVAELNIDQETKDRFKALSKRLLDRGGAHISTTPKTVVNEIAATLPHFVPAGYFGEIRVIGSGAPFGFYFGHDCIPQAAALAAEYSRTAKGVYFVMNRIAPALSERPQLVKTFTLTTDADIVRRIMLLIDFDPSSPERGTNDSATDAEKEAARLKMEEVFEWLQALGFPEPVFADSGNGWHLLFAIDLPNDEESHRLIRDVLQALSKRFSDDQVAVDISVHNASRITKLYGTAARKGVDRTDRPHRPSKLVSVPEDMWVVSAELIVAATQAALAEATPATADGSLFDRPAAPRINGGNLDGFTPTPKLILPETFPVGGRHDLLLKVAGAMRSFGATETEILAALREFNRTRCGGQKPDDELQKIARDYARRDCNLSMKALIECATPEQVESAEQQQKLRHALQHGLKKLREGRSLDEVAGAISTVLGTITATSTPQEFATMTSAELDAADLRTDYLVEDVLARGQPFIIAAAKKMLKTNISIDLALSLASGCKFLDKFYVPKAVHVALMSGESGDAVIQETARRIARSKPWRNLRDYTNAIWSFDLPRLGQPQTKEDLTKFIGDHALDVLIVDPAYLCLDLGDDAGNLFSVGKKLAELTEIMHDTRCTIGIVHHNKKNVTDPFAAPELESIAWAGFQEWCRQWILLGRRGAYDPEQAGSHKLWLSVGGSAGHSGLWALDIEEGSRKDQGGRRWDVSVETASTVIAATIESREEAKVIREEQKAAARITTDSAKLLKIYERTPEGTTAKAAREEAAWSGTRFAPANAKLLADQKICPCQVTRTNRRFDGFCVIESCGTHRDAAGLVPLVPLKAEGSGQLSLEMSRPDALSDTDRAIKPEDVSRSESVPQVSDESVCSLAAGA